MRKTDLKVGEEYAVVMRPQRGRSRYNRATPIRATLVNPGGRVERTVKVFARDPKTRKLTDAVEEAVSFEKGIVVKLAEPRERSVPKVYDGVRADGTAYRSFGYSADGNKREMEKIVETEIALENAGCFVSTWADYQAELIREAEAKVAREKHEAEDFEKARQGEPAVRDRLDALVAMLRARGFAVELEEHGQSYLSGGKRGAGPDYEIFFADDAGRRWQVGEIPVQLHYGTYSSAPVNPLTGFRLELKNEAAVTRALALDAELVA